jgi:hypothetical protein
MIFLLDTGSLYLTADMAVDHIPFEKSVGATSPENYKRGKSNLSISRRKWLSNLNRYRARLYTFVRRTWMDKSSLIDWQRFVGLIDHSDRGSRYCSKNYQKLLKQFGVIASKSRKGN